MTRTAEEALAARTTLDSETGCINWTGATNPKGYGRLKVGGRNGNILLPHRVAYEIAKGPIPAGLVIDHLCRNPACCNPDHLEAVTHAENVRRGLSGAKEAAKTHCPQGHPYGGANLYRSRAGHRHCRACMAAREKATRPQQNARRRKNRLLKAAHEPILPDPHTPTGEA